MNFEAFYSAVRELQLPKLNKFGKLPKSGRGYISEAADFRGLSLPASTSKHKKTFKTSFHKIKIGRV